MSGFTAEPSSHRAALRIRSLSFQTAGSSVLFHCNPAPNSCTHFSALVISVLHADPLTALAVLKTDPLAEAGGP